MMRTCALLIAVLAAIATGCHCCDPEGVRERREAATAYDEIESTAAQWGTLGVSAELVIDDTGQFKTDLEQPLADYVKRARDSVNGAASRFSEFAFQGSLSAAVTSDKLGHGTATASADPVTPTAAHVLSSDRFKDFLALLAASPAMSDGDALKIGFSHKVQEMLLRFLTHPKGFDPDLQLFWGVVQVSCNPGWLTKEGYIADVNVTAEYVMTATAFIAEMDRLKKPLTLCERNRLLKRGYITSREDPAPEALGAGEVHPEVFSVFPLIEAQVLDVKNSQRRQVAWMNTLAGALAQSGFTGEAKIVTDQVSRLSFDAASKDPLPVISSYASSSDFGYRIQPAFTALEDASDKGSEVSKVLNPVAFPALVLFACRKSDIRLWPEIALEVNSRWIPMERRPWYKRWFLDWWLYRYGFELTNVRRIELAEGFDLISGLKHVGSTEASKAAREVRMRYPYMDSLLFGRMMRLKIPVDPAPAVKITGVEPRSGWVNAELALTVTGTGFARHKLPIVESVTVGGRACSVRVLGDGVLVAMLPAAPTTTAFLGMKYSVTVATPEGASTVADAIELFPAGKRSNQPAPEPPPPHIASVTPTAGWSNGETVLVLRGKGFKSSGEDAVKKVLVGGRECPSVTVSEEVVIAVAPAWSNTPLESNFPRFPITLVGAAGVTQSSDIVVFSQPLTVSATPTATLTVKDGRATLTVSPVTVDAAARDKLLETLREIAPPRPSLDINVELGDTKKPPETKKEK
jgi:hypothetical protein